MVTNCADMIVTQGIPRTGAGWAEGLGAALNLVPGLREAGQAGTAVRIAGFAIAGLAIVAAIVLLMNARKTRSGS